MYFSSVSHVSSVATVQIAEDSVVITVVESDPTVEICMEILLVGSLGFDLEIPITLHGGAVAGKDLVT